MACPIPLVPPVTRAVWPSSEKSSFTFDIFSPFRSISKYSSIVCIKSFQCSRAIGKQSCSEAQRISVIIPQTWTPATVPQHSTTSAGRRASAFESDVRWTAEVGNFGKSNPAGVSASEVRDTRRRSWHLSPVTAHQVVSRLTRPKSGAMAALCFDTSSELVFLCSSFSTNLVRLFALLLVND